jgi:hypothetical protein
MIQFWIIIEEVRIIYCQFMIESGSRCSNIQQVWIIGNTFMSISIWINSNAVLSIKSGQSVKFVRFFMKKNGYDLKKRISCLPSIINYLELFCKNILPKLICNCSHFYLSLQMVRLDMQDEFFDGLLYWTFNAARGYVARVSVARLWEVFIFILYGLDFFWQILICDFLSVYESLFPQVFVQKGGKDIFFKPIYILASYSSV